MAVDFVLSNSDFLNTGSNLGIALPFSGSVWFNPDSIPAAGNFTSIISAETPGASNQHFSLWLTDNGKVRAQVYNGGSTAFALSGTAASAGAWNHVAFEFASTTSRSCWVNGGTKGTNATSVTTPSLTDFRIGLTDVSWTNIYYDGIVAFVTLWNDNLSDAEVAMLAKGVFAPRVKPNNMIEHWDMTRRLRGIVANTLLSTGGGSPSITTNPKDISGFNAVPYLRQLISTITPAAQAETQLIGVPTVEDIGIADPDDLAQAQVLGAITVEAHGTIVDDLSQGQSIEVPTVTAHGTLVNDLDQGQFLELGSVTIHGMLVDDLAHSHEITVPILEINLEIAPNPLVHAQTLDSPTVPIHGTLVNNLSETNAISLPTLVPDGTIVIDFEQANSLTISHVYIDFAVMDNLSNGQSLNEPDNEKIYITTGLTLSNSQTIEETTADVDGTQSFNAMQANHLSTPTIWRMSDTPYFWAGWDGQRLLASNRPISDGRILAAGRVARF